jgi:acetylornithine deacetylase/succinyl-diaminopimelate desuccinylase-like protein
MGIDGLLEQCGLVSAAEVSELTLRLLNEWTPPGAETPVARILAEELLAAGADEVYLDEEFEGSPSVICWLRGREPGPTMQWHGHLDAIATPHSAPLLEDGIIKGRGACDMKGALAAMVAGVKILQKSGYPRHGQLLLTFHGLHEEGGSRPLLRLFERGIVGDAVLIGELASGPQLITSSGGLTFWDLDLSSGAEPVHETNRGSDTPDLLAAALQVHSALMEYSRLVEARGGSIYIGKFSVGDYYNRVPVSATISGTRRHTGNENLDSVKADFEDFVRRVEAQIQLPIRLHVDSITDAYGIDPECGVARALRSAYFQFTGEPMKAKVTKSVGNAAHFVRIAGIPAIYHGANYASAHSDNEQTTVAELVRLAGVYALTTAYFLEPDAPPPPALGE